MLQNLRISVGRTWRLATDRQAAAAWDLTGYRARLDELKNAGAADFGLPWPSYHSRLWTRMFTMSYQAQRSAVLVAALLPLLHRGEPVDAPHCRPGGEVEALLHPFAVTTLLHLTLAPALPWPPDDDAAALLRAVLTSPRAGADQLRDGVPLDRLPALPVSDFSGVPAGFSDAGRFVLVSALYEGTPDPAAVAGCLAGLLETPASGAHPLRSEGSALCVSDGVVGVALPNALPRAGTRVRCLHHNLATLLAYQENLATLTPAEPTVAARWFQDRAAVLLNRLYHRAPLPETGGIYRSRLPAAWIDHRGIAPFVNALTGSTLPPIPVRP